MLGISTCWWHNKFFQGDEIVSDILELGLEGGATGPAPDADQPGPKQNINTGGSRCGSNVVLQGGFMWAVQSVSSGGRAAVRWAHSSASWIAST